MSEQTKRVRPNRKRVIQAVLDEPTWLKLAVVVESLRTAKRDPLYSHTQFIRDMIEGMHRAIQRRLDRSVQK